MATTFSITDLEFIQAVQNRSHSVPMIGHKPTFLRVSVRSGIPIKLTGRLRLAAGGPEITPVNAPVVTKPNGSDRRVWNETLNFRLTDAMTVPGEQQFLLRIFPENNEANLEKRTIDIRFSPRIDLHIYGVVWAVKNNNDHQGAPIGPAAPWSDWEGHRKYVENVYPVSTLTIDPVPGVGTVPPNPQPFGNLVESRTWGTEQLKKLPENSVIALLDNWDTGGLNGFYEGRRCETQNARDPIRIGVVLAQELAHCLGVWWHTFDPGTPYPRPNGEIADDDVGLDLTGAQPRLVTGAFDFMSYGLSPALRNWGSAFTYLELLKLITGGAQGDAADGLPRWHPDGWESLGGRITDSPAAVNWSADRIDIVARGLDGAVYHKYWNGRQWGPSNADWESLGGGITDSPSIVSWGSNRLDVFARGLDGSVYHKYWNGRQWGPSAAGWEGLGGKITGSPVAVSWGPNRLDLFARGLDGAVWHKYFNGAQWGPTQFDWESLGGGITGIPAAVCWAGNRIDVFARGIDGSVYHKYWNGSQWGPSQTGWDGLGGGITDSPVAVSWGANRLDVFARGLDGAVWHQYWNGSSWGPGWESLGGSIIGPPAAVCWAKNRIDIIVKGLNEGVWHKSWSGANWSPLAGAWSALGGKIDGNPVPVSWSANRLDLLVRGKDQGVWHRYRADVPDLAARAVGGS